MNELIKYGNSDYKQFGHNVQLVLAKQCHWRCEFHSEC